MSVSILIGDCRGVMSPHGPFDMIIADPPYGDTSLEWDRKVNGWQFVAQSCLKPTGSLWVFGSLRFFMAEADKFEDAGLR
jgi:site-specific DNA-methyltransferase (adenine-specific)